LQAILVPLTIKPKNPSPPYGGDMSQGKKGDPRDAILDELSKTAQTGVRLRQVLASSETTIGRNHPADENTDTHLAATLANMNAQQQRNLINAAGRRGKGPVICAYPGCKNVIPTKRLKAVPGTEFCITCQEKIERQR